MQDPRFERAVIFVCNHDENGAMGLVINKTKGELSLSYMLDQIGIEGDVKVADTAVLNGGPVDINRGFVLHSPDYRNAEHSMILSDTLVLTSTKDVLESLVTDKAPERAIMAVGYSGWSEGQLEDELASNAWLVVDAEESLIFSNKMADKWTAALKHIGVTPDMLSSFGGSA